MIAGWWGWAGVGIFVGLVFGIAFFPWVASPFGPGIPFLNPKVAKLFFTVSQFLRGKGMLVKRASGVYEIGTYDGDAKEVVLSDTRLLIDPKRTRWGLFGKRAFGITWEPGTDLHQRVARDEVDKDNASLSLTHPFLDQTDGGGYPINMAAVHRIFRGTNDADAITRTEEKSKAKHGGGDTTFDDKWMAAFIVLMLLLGSFTSWFMLGGLG